MEGLSEKEKELILSDKRDENLYKNEEKQDQKTVVEPDHVVKSLVSKQEINKQDSSKEENKVDPLKEIIKENPVSDESLRRMNQLAPDDDDFELIGSKEAVMAQMETEMSLGTSLLVGKVTEESKKAARQQYRDMYNNKVNERRAMLTDEIKQYIEKNRLFAERRGALANKITALSNEKKTKNVLSDEKEKELQALQLELADLDKVKDKNSAIIKRRKETKGLLKQDLKIRFIVATYREKLEKEKAKGNSALMNNMIAKVEAFDNLVNSPDFDIAKQYAYIKEFVDMRNAIALYHNKNKGYKWFEKGEYRRDLAYNFLKNLNIWIADMPEEIQDTFIQEMEKPEYEPVRALETSDEMYQELGEKAFKAQAADDGHPELDVKEYVTPLTIRLMSVQRARLRESTYAEELDLTQAEREQILAGDKNKDPNIKYQDPRSWIYTFLGIKKNYDGTTVNPEMENIIKEGVSAWRHNDLEKMRPFLDKMINDIMDYDVKLEDFLPENLKKNGPALLVKQDLMMSIQNVFFAHGTIGEAYLNEKGPALRAKLEMIRTLNPFVPLFHDLCADMNISTGGATVGKVTGFEIWVKQNKGKKTGAFIRKMIENPESLQNMVSSYSLERRGVNVNHIRVPEPDTPTAIRKKYHLAKNAVDTTKELIIPFENNYLTQMTGLLEGMIQRGEYFDDINKDYRKYKVAKDLKALITENSEYEEQILDVYHQIESKEDEVSKCNNREKKAKLKEELVRLHKQKDDFMTYIKTVHEKRSDIEGSFPELKNRFLANFFGYKNRNPELANKYNAKRLTGARLLPTGKLSAKPGLLMNLIKKAEYEKKADHEFLVEETKIAHQDYLNTQNELVRLREEHALLQVQLDEETGTANSLIGTIFKSEANEGVPVENRTNISNSLIGKEYRDRFKKLLAKKIEKQKVIVDLEKQSRDILWKKIYQLTEIKDKDGNAIPREKSERILDIMNEYMRAKEYCEAIKSERGFLQDYTEYFSKHVDELGFTKALADFDQSINEQYAHIDELKNQLVALCKDEFPNFENADITEIEGTLKNNILFMTGEDVKTLLELEKDEFVNDKIYAYRAAGPSTMEMTKEGAELAYRRTHNFPAEEFELLRRYVAPGSADDQKIRNRFEGGNIDRIVCAGLHFIRFDANHKILPEDIKKDEWNKKWIKACISDDYENDIKPLLQGMMDELLKFADLPYSDRTSDDYHLQDDAHFQDYLRMCKLGLTFESNILNNEFFSKFKEDYENANPEDSLKWKKLQVFNRLGSLVNIISDMKIRAKYLLAQGYDVPADSPLEAAKQVDGFYKEAKIPAYGCEVFKYAEKKMFSADPADVFLRMAEIPNFSIDHVDEYADFFKFYAAVDDMDANIQEANKRLAEINTAMASEQSIEELAALTSEKEECTVKLRESEAKKQQLLAGKQAMLDRVNRAPAQNNVR